ncbi:HNH endonuclease family protein, partial [Helicobacter sp. CLO-3]|uniref:HNH endonuclease family protein n=1 Tax=Helicobacter sp. CLO-3 TaxID=211 RepID=UPI000A9788CF
RDRLYIQKLANIYYSFPNINKNTVFTFDEYEERFFHIIETLNMNSVLPLVIYLKDTLQKSEQTYRQCLYMLEVLILCNFKTKDYNKFFARIIKESKKENEDLQKFLKNEIEESSAYLSCLQIDSVKEWLCNITNSNAKLILFWIELYRQHKEKDYKDKIGLEYAYTLEHLMPQKWQEHWGDIGKNNEKAESLIYQIGNMTLLRSKLNTALSNLDWQTKLHGDGKARNYIGKNADLLITRELLNKKEWDENEIKKRTEQFIKDFIEIWDITIFNHNNTKGGRNG